MINTEVRIIIGSLLYFCFTPPYCHTYSYSLSFGLAHILTFLLVHILTLILLHKHLHLHSDSYYYTDTRLIIRIHARAPFIFFLSFELISELVQTLLFIHLLVLKLKLILTLIFIITLSCCFTIGTAKLTRGHCSETFWRRFRKNVVKY